MKSHESDQVGLVREIYRDISAKCVAIQFDERDMMTIMSRVEHEGISFLTITLPTFGKEFERSLSQGCVDSTCFQSFRKHGAIPSFLKGMLSQVFDQDTGGILDEEKIDPNIIEGIRQIAYTFKKLRLDCSPERVTATLRNFIQTEYDLNEAIITKELLQDFLEVSHLLWDPLFSDINVTDLEPRHGPGATAERISGNQKFHWRFWHKRIEPYFPLLDTAYTLGSYGSEEFDDVTLVDEDMEQPVRVTPVPKTQKGPRIIAIEPCCMQYAQQAIRRVLYSTLESVRMTKGHVNFTDQSINQRLAMRASRDDSMATLDLSDASDRVILSLAQHMFDGNPDLQDAILACRSKRAEMPDGTVIGPLSKFASMGSALCFPVESMYFYTICVVALLKKRKLPVTTRNIYDATRCVYVYGDDIIVPSAYAMDVTAALRYCGFSLNVSKSFLSGPFRESCGGDFFCGVDVRPHFIKKVPNEPTDWIVLANGLFRRWFNHPTDYKRVRRARSFAIGNIPRDLRSCRGPAELGDTVITSPPEQWRAVRVIDSQRWFRALVPMPKRLAFNRYDENTQMAAALYGVGPEGYTLRRGGKDEIAGYKVRWLAFS